MEWISVKDKVPDMLEEKNYSENVLAVCDGKLMVMCYCYVADMDGGGFVWANCYGDIDGDGEYDDEYKPTCWMPLPEPPKQQP